MVDGALASCYGSFDHDLAHISVTPIQWFPQVMEQIFGLDSITPVYVSLAEYLGRGVLPQSQLFNNIHFY